ncbi:MAG: Holliday junction branch migration protein RuvA [Pseudomonadota bacterium]
MISRLKGIILEKKPPFLIIDVRDIGYAVETSMQTFYQLPEIGETIVLYTHFVVREDAQMLFGFLDEKERRLFRSLIKVNGVGPKMALAILSTMVPDEFIHCINEQNLKQLTRIPGVGKKTAERLCIEIRDRLKDWQPETDAVSSTTQQNYDDAKQQQRDAIDALIALGYNSRDAEKAVKSITEEGLSSEQLIRLSLKNL